jgi:hypothetical protein
MRLAPWLAEAKGKRQGGGPPPTGPLSPSIASPELFPRAGADLPTAGLLAPGSVRECLLKEDAKWCFRTFVNREAIGPPAAKGRQVGRQAGQAKKGLNPRQPMAGPLGVSSGGSLLWWWVVVVHGDQSLPLEGPSVVCP